jgi:hypothetical protein
MIARDIMKDLREAVECPPPIMKGHLTRDLALILGRLSGQDAGKADVPAPVAPRKPVEDQEPQRPLRAMLDELATAQPDRLPWPADWLEGTDSGEAAACRRMWADVLRCALGDICRAVMDAPVRQSRRNEGAPARFSWIGGKDFRIICALAGFEPDAIADRVVPMLQSAETARALYGRLFQPNREVGENVG